MLSSGHNLTLAYEMNDAMTLKSITAYRQTSRRGGDTLGAALPAGVSSSGFVYTWWHFEHMDQEQPTRNCSSSAPGSSST